MLLATVVLLLDSLPVEYGRALLRDLHTYDIVRYEVEAELRPDGLRVDCALTLRVERPGPIRLLLSPHVEGLTVELAGEPVPASLGTGGFETALRVFAGEVQGVPSLLTLTPARGPPAGAEATFRLRYLWAPPAGGWQHASVEGLQTHLAGFWVPTMGDELFQARIHLKTGLAAVGPGRREKVDDGWRFETDSPVQALPLFAAPLTVHGEGRLQVWLPPALGAEAEGALEDLTAVLERLEAWFPGGDRPFVLAVESRTTPGPSYCGGDFVVVEGEALGPRVRRRTWISLLAHECSHRWWGYAVATPVIGGGGTWLREGLAQWSGTRVTGALLGAPTERALWRGTLRRYLARADLRRPAGEPGAIFANEPTLLDATYLDDPAVPYLRGALVFRLLEHEAGSEAFRAGLAAFVKAPREGLATLAELAAAVGAERTIDYYARTTRLPDLALEDVEVGDGYARARITCADALWPGGRVPVVVETATSTETVAVEVREGRGTLAWKGEGIPARIEVDPERLYLDPHQENNAWEP